MHVDRDGIEPVMHDRDAGILAGDPGTEEGKRAQYVAVSLDACEIHAGDGDRVFAQCSCAEPEGGIRPVAFDDEGAW